MVTGPFSLVQGGQAISGRLAVYLPQNDGTELKWGLVSITLSFPEVMEETAENKLDEQSFSYRLQKLDSESNSYVEVLNHTFQDGHDFESVNFSVESMEFILKAYPTHGWFDIKNALMIFSGLAIGIFILELLAYIAYDHLRSIRIRAEIDELTGLTNRAAGERTINHILAQNTFKKGAFILLDIDHFKSVNDTLGHKCGDEVLTESANGFKLIFQGNDVICRLGGDEFVVFMLYSGGDDFLVDKANQLSNTMRKQVIRDGKAVSISCSIGISLAPQHGASFAVLYESADKALYHAKKQGRDRAVYFDTSTDFGDK